MGSLKKVDFGFGFGCIGVDHNRRTEGRHRQVCRRGCERSGHCSVFCTLIWTSERFLPPNGHFELLQERTNLLL